MQNIDTWLFLLINQSMANGLFDVLMPSLTHQGYLLVLPAALYTVILGARNDTGNGRKYLPAAIAALCIAGACVPLSDLLAGQIKELTVRPRPCQVLEGVRLLVACPRSFSLPSSHAATSFSFAVPLFLLTRQFVPLRWRAFPLALAAAVAFSRPYLGVHYPSDIAAGAFLGAAVAAVPCRLYLVVTQKAGMT